MFVKTLEAIHTSASKRKLHTYVMVAVFALQIVGTAAHLGIRPANLLNDFDNFYLVAQKVWLGDADQLYQHSNYLAMQREAWGNIERFFAWPYPPQYDLFVAPFAQIPLWAAYTLFVTSTLVFFLFVLRALARRDFTLLLVVLFPTVLLTAGDGQNGFLTAGLLGLVCLCLEERPIVAGLALGAMVIKPHFAIAFALYVILRRCWTAAAAAGIVVLASSAFCTIVFGTHIWAGLIQSNQDNIVLLKDGTFPLYRMISFYSALSTAGLPSSVAFLGQAIVAVTALGGISFVAYRGASSRIGLGLTAMLSVCISPYAFDYDFPIFGIGLALMLPVLREAASVRERGAIYIATILVGAFSILQRFILGALDPVGGANALVSLGGFTLVGLIGLLLIIVARPKTHAHGAELSSFSPETGRGL